MSFNYFNILAIFLSYIISCLSIMIINENNNGLPFCYNLSTILINL